LNKEHKQLILKFFASIYPFSELDPQLIVAEVWPRLTAQSFHEGDILKPYGTFGSELFIICEGEVSIFSQVKDSANDILLNRYGEMEIIGEQNIQVKAHLSHKVVVTSKEVKVFAMFQKTFSQIFQVML